MDPTLFKALLTLSGVVALMAALLYVVKKYTAQKSAGCDGAQFRVLGRVALQQKQGVYLLLVGDKLLVVGATDHAVSILSEIDDAETIDRFVNGANSTGIPLFGTAGGTRLQAKPSPEQTSGSMLSFAEFLKSLSRQSTGSTR